MDAQKYLESNVSRETFSRFRIHLENLEKWQKKTNLVSRETIPDAWHRHILDSYQLTLIISDKTKKIIDIGSGAGFPGMILAYCGYSNVHLVESNKKKILFLKEIARINHAQVKIHHQKIQDFKSPNTDIIISRALSSLKNLFELSEPFTQKTTSCIFLKGQNYNQEINEANIDWSFDYHTAPSITSSQSHIIIATNIKKRS